jgi:ABC-type multidrug transport system ATPase subunit
MSSDIHMRSMNILSHEKSDIHVKWENISVYTDEIRRRHVLEQVSGYACAGRILAIIGTTKSGKSTLIDLLSGRSLDDKLVFDSNKGLIFLNKQRITDRQILIDRCSHIQQANRFSTWIDSITVREHLTFQVRYGTLILS